MQKKISKLQQKRWAIQTGVFLLIFTVFITYRLYLTGIIQFKLTGIGTFNPFAGYDIMFQWATRSFYRPNYKSFALILAVVILFLPFISGRFFCGWICPFGTLQDYLSSLGNRILKSRDHLKGFINRRWVHWLELIKYGVLALIIISKGIYGSSFLTVWDPWTAFANLPVLFHAVQTIPLAFVILTAVIIGAFFWDRFFCRFFCPLGALQGLVSLLSLSKIVRQIKCVKCGNCQDICPVDINLVQAENDFSPECIYCLKCLEHQCHKESVFRIALGKRVLSPLTYLMISLIIFGCSLYLLRQTGFIIAQREIYQVKGKDNSTYAPIYQDGVYNGWGRGFAPGLEVKVQVKEGRIIAIDVVKHQETWGYYEETFDALSRQMVDFQSSDVDVITGATYSGNGLKEAVENALKQAYPKQPDS